VIDTLGFIAAALTTLSFLPQVVRTWKTRSAEDLSLSMLVAFNLGVVIWLVYGIALGALPIIVANVVTLALSLTLLVLKLTVR
jgi:MtN3 and saliva related transmembrane protein